MIGLACVVLAYFVKPTNREKIRRRLKNFIEITEKISAYVPPPISMIPPPIVRVGSESVLLAHLNSACHLSLSLDTRQIRVHMIFR